MSDRLEGLDFMEFLHNASSLQDLDIEIDSRLEELRIAGEALHKVKEEQERRNDS